MSLHKNTTIQFRISKEYKDKIVKVCIDKDIKMSTYILNLIINDLKLTPETKPLIYGVDWEL